MLFIDGAYYFATDTAYSVYRSEIAETIKTWVADTLDSLNDILIKTKNFFKNQ
jgi:hypothetical protein